MLFVNIPVADLERSTAFFAKLGFRFDPNVSSRAEVDSVAAAALAAGGVELATAMQGADVSA